MMNVKRIFNRKNKNQPKSPQQHAGSFVVRNAKDYMAFQYHQLVFALNNSGIKQGMDFDGITVKGSYKINTFSIVNPQKGVFKSVNGMIKDQDLPMTFGISSEKSLRVSYTEGQLGKRSSIMVEVPKRAEYQQEVGFRQVIEGITATHTAIGMNTQNVPSWIDYNDGTTAHALVGGFTGSGKTNTMKSMALSGMQGIDPGDAYFMFMDLEKGMSEWGVMENCAFLACPVITRYDQAAQALAWLKIEKEQRYQRNNIANEKPIYVYTDEFATLVFGDKDVSNMFGELHGTSRGAKIYFISGSTSANKDLFGDVRIKDNMKIRIVGAVNSPEDSKLMTGRAGVGAESLRDAGDFIYVNGYAQRVAVPFIHESFWNELPRGENYLFDLKGGCLRSQAQETRQVTQPAQQIEDISAIQAARSLDEKLLSLCIYVQNKQGKPMGATQLSDITRKMKLNGGTKGYSPATVQEYQKVARFLKGSQKQALQVQRYYEKNK